MSLQEDAKKMLPFIQAMAEGKTVQTRNLLNGKWIESSDWLYHTCPQREHRIKPEPVYRPWTPEEVIERVGFLIRRKEFPNEAVGITGYCDEKVITSVYCCTCEQLLQDFVQYHGDRPCGIMEPSKDY